MRIGILILLSLTFNLKSQINADSIIDNIIYGSDQLGWTTYVCGDVIEENESAQIANDSLNVTPNPFQKRTCAFYSFSQNDTVSLTIYNYIGQNILSIKTDVVLISGFYQDSIIMDAYLDGIYFAHLKLGKRKTIVKKIIKTSCTTPLGLVASNSAISCIGACDATATVYVASGGTPPYNYTWTPTSANTNTISNACPGYYTITVVDSNGCEGNSNLIILNPSNPCVGIKEYSFSYQISIYPNPVSKTLFISNKGSEFENSEIEIINCLGHVVLKSPYINEIDVSNLSSGCYVIKISTSDKKHLHSKLIKE